MMKIILLFSLLITCAFGNEVEITTIPKEPVAGESFNVEFKVKTQKGTDPLISFNPSGVEVLGREESGISTRTTYMNGKLSVERSISIVYELMAPRAGSAYLRNIEVEVSGEKIKHKNLRIRVLSRARKPKDIMAIAVPDKEEAFVGESILVRYYLYSKISVTSYDIKKFPKLKKFLKRFHQERVRPERVQLGGDIYERRLMYTAQLFAEKPGKYKIDPMSINVSYLKSRGGNGFGGFGFRRQMKKSLSSKSLEVTIKALPIDGVPSDFTGLVGKHSFELKLNKNKFLVNEPIEMKLAVKGEGALELFETPKILESDKLEEFESTNDFQVTSDFKATKDFNITYLGRENYSSPPKKITFSIFNPDSYQYETIELDLGSIVVAGAQIRGRTGESASNTPSLKPKQNKPITSPNLEYDLTPVYTLKNNYIFRKKTINIFLALILGIILLLKIKKIWENYQLREVELIDEIKSEGLTYGRLHLLLSKLAEANSMRESVEKSNLSKGTKAYLYKMIEKCESFYKEDKDIGKLKIKSKVLSEISKKIKELDEA